MPSNSIWGASLWIAELSPFVCLIYPSGSDSDEADGQDAEEEGEPLLAVEKRARILDKKRYYPQLRMCMTQPCCRGAVSESCLA